jgi:hypothetical protein
MLSPEEALFKQLLALRQKIDPSTAQAISKFDTHASSPFYRSPENQKTINQIFNMTHILSANQRQRRSVGSGLLAQPSRSMPRESRILDDSDKQQRIFQNDLQQLLRSREKTRVFKSPKKIPPSYSELATFKRKIERTDLFKTRASLIDKASQRPRCEIGPVFKNSKLFYVKVFPFAELLQKIYYEKARFEDLFQYLPVCFVNLKDEESFFEEIMAEVRVYCLTAKELILNELRALAKKKGQVLQPANNGTAMASQMTKLMIASPKKVIKIVNLLYSLYENLQDATVEVNKISKFYFERQAKRRYSKPFDSTNLHYKYFMGSVCTDTVIFNYLMAVNNFVLKEWKTNVNFSSHFESAARKINKIYTNLDMAYPENGDESFENEHDPLAFDRQTGEPLHHLDQSIEHTASLGANAPYHLPLSEIRNSQVSDPLQEPVQESTLQKPKKKKKKKKSKAIITATAESPEKPVPALAPEPKINEDDPKYLTELNAFEASIARVDARAVSGCPGRLRVVFGSEDKLFFLSLMSKSSSKP